MYTLTREQTFVRSIAFRKKLKIAMEGHVPAGVRFRVDTGEPGRPIRKNDPIVIWFFYLLGNEKLPESRFPIQVSLEFEQSAVDGMDGLITNIMSRMPDIMSRMEKIARSVRDDAARFVDGVRELDGLPPAGEVTGEVTGEVASVPDRSVGHDSR